jgi:two-component sensor histidine kinase
MKLRIYFPHKRTFTANLIIGVSIALFFYYLKETSLLESLLARLTDFLVRGYLTLARNRFAYATSPLGVLVDALGVIGAALLWTYLKTVPGRILGTLCLALVLLPVAVFVYRGYGVILTSSLIVLGIAVAMALEGGRELLSREIHARILDQKKEAEFSILGHLNHNVKPNLQIAKSPIVAVLDFLEARGVNGEVLAKRLDGSDETVGEALQRAVLSLDQIGGILEQTRKLVTHQIPRDAFSEVAIVPLLAQEIAPLYADRLRIVVTGEDDLTLRLHRESFVEAINNLIRNALTHAFGAAHPDPRLCFAVRETRNKLTIDYTNNGRPFPANLDAKDFLSCGRKSHDSPGEGLGGAWIGKVVEAHRGSFEIVRDEHPLHFRMIFPKRGA